MDDTAVAAAPLGVVINKYAGTVRRLGIEAVERSFRDALGPRLVSLQAGRGKDMPRMVDNARQAGAGIILPIGGDGTCTAIAEMARRDGFVASALPGGTKNILAKRLWGEATTLPEIATMIGNAAVRIHNMDAGEANGRLFFVGASFGMIPHLARARERLRGRAEPSGLWAALRHVGRLGRRGLFHPRVVVTAPGAGAFRCAALMVSVKSIDEMLLRAGEKDDPASFDCAAASPEGWSGLTWLALRASFTDTWRDETKIRSFNVPQLDVDGRSPMAVALDGEAVALPAPVKLTMLQNAIPMLGRA
jgi:diacylglycerol kinase family enzyme